MPVTLRLEPSPEVKKETINSLLSDRVGLIIKGKNCVVVAIKSPITVNILRYPGEDLGHCPEHSGKNAKLFIWGLGDSVAAKRSFGIEFGRFENELRNKFSYRDLNFVMLNDFISGYLRKNLYNRESDEPLALEFILAEIALDGITFSVINFDGDSKFLKESSFAIIGCTSDKVKEELTKSLDGLNLGNLSAKEISESVQPLLKKFKGDFFLMTFFLKNRKPSKRKNKLRARR